MNLENIHFIEPGVSVNFKKLTEKIISILNDNSINFNLTELQIQQVINVEHLINVNFHSGGCTLTGKEFEKSQAKIFEMKFEGEGKRFLIEAEYNNSNPDGFISYFVSPDVSSTALKAIGEVLKKVASDVKVAVPKVEKKSVQQPLKQEEPEPTFEPKVVKKSTELENETDVKSIVENPNYLFYKSSEHKNKSCYCPQNEELYKVKNPFTLEKVSSRIRKLLVFENKGEVIICKCEHCGSHLFFENASDSFLLMLNNKTADYLISMKSQLEIIVNDKGVNILREKILSASK